MDMVADSYQWLLDMQDSYLYPYPWYCTHTCTHGLRPGYTYDHIYTTNKVSKKVVIFLSIPLPPFFLFVLHIISYIVLYMWVKIFEI